MKAEMKTEINKVESLIEKGKRKEAIEILDRYWIETDVDKGDRLNILCSILPEYYTVGEEGRFKSGLKEIKEILGQICNYEVLEQVDKLVYVLSKRMQVCLAERRWANQLVPLCSSILRGARILTDWPIAYSETLIVLLYGQMVLRRPKSATKTFDLLLEMWANDPESKHVRLQPVFNALLGSVGFIGCHGPYVEFLNPEDKTRFQELAIKVFEARKSSENPEGPHNPLFEAAETYCQLGEYKHAAETHEELIEIVGTDNKQRHSGLNYLADCYMKAGEKEKEAKARQEIKELEEKVYNGGAC